MKYMEHVILIGEELYNKLNSLSEEFIDKENWLVFYIDKKTGEKWVKEYPYAELQGGGPPQLRLIKNFPWEQEN